MARGASGQTRMMRRLVGKIQPYAWGSTTFLPELLGVKPTGEPQAELWLGAHPLGPAMVGDERLDDLVSDDPEGVIGEASVAQFGPRLPYLLKVLAAAKPLSLQAHPSRVQAEKGYIREQEAGVARDAPNRTYRDGWPKPEVLCALGEAEVLCGFREPAQTYALFEQLAVASALDLVKPLRAGTADQLKEVFGRILRLADSEREVITEVAVAARKVGGSGDLAEFARTARQTAEPYPDDPGVLAALLMNRLTLRQNDAIFLPAGNLHAYLHGCGVEIMANSDNVLRGGLTPKHVDVEELMKVLDFTPGFPGLVPCVEGPAGVWAYQTPAPEFALWRLESMSASLPVPRSDSGRILLVTEGSVSVRSPTEQLDLSRGQSAFITADDQVRVQGHGVVFVAGPGIG
jgi:mannose-6-phosphate isomerase